MAKTKALVVRGKAKKLLDTLQKEIEDEGVDMMKGKAKELIKNIRRTEIILEKQKSQLKAMLQGKITFTEEEYLFE